MFYDVWLAGQSLWNIPLLAALICIAGLYLLLYKYVMKVKIYHQQPLLFFCSLLLLYVTIGSPLASISHLSFSFHMIQMSILFFIIPPLLLLGIPKQLWLQIRGLRWLKGISPFAALCAFAVLFFIYHFRLF